MKSKIKSIVKKPYFKKLLMLVVFIAVLAATFYAGYSFKESKDTTPTKAASPEDKPLSISSVPYEVSLQQKGTEYTMLVYQVSTDSIDGSQSKDAAQKIAKQKADELAQTVSLVTGKEEDTKKLEDIYGKLNDQLIAYAAVAKSGGQAKKDSVTSEINSSFTDPLVAYLSTAVSNIDQRTMGGLLNDYVTQTVNSIEQYANGKTEDSIQSVLIASGDANSIYGLIAQAINEK